MKGGWDERPFLPLPPPSPYTQHCAERENSYTHVYIACTCSNAKVISPVTCRSSVKYLMNPRPVEAFLSTLSRERARRPLRPFFFFHDAPTTIVSLEGSDLRLKAIWNVRATKVSRTTKSMIKKKGCEITEVHERLRSKKHIKDTKTREPHGYRWIVLEIR